MTDLTKIEKPFGLLDEETQRALKAWPHGWEMYYRGNWDEIAPSWTVDATYRAKPAPVTKPSLPNHVWAALDSRWQWMARDGGDGSVYLYEDCPKLDSQCVEFIAGGIFKNITHLFHDLDPGTCDWRDSLVKRPEYEGRQDEL